MNEADQELRETVRKLWPLQTKKGAVDIAVPPDDGNGELQGFLDDSFPELAFQRLTIGKIYAGKLILECYRAKQSGQSFDVGLGSDAFLYPSKLIS